MEWKKGNTFGFVAFLSYGCFWEALVFLELFQRMGISDEPDFEARAWFCFIWGIFSTGMFIATLKSAPFTLIFVFLTLVALFFLLAAYFWTESLGVKKAAGIAECIYGLSAIYVAFGELLNATYGRTILWLGIRTPKKPLLVRPKN
jgi:succinate-acetate transporter protein